MQHNPRVAVAHRLAIEKQLLREEKYLVYALKAVKEERFALQREGADLLCLLQEAMKEGKPSNPQGNGSETLADLPEIPPDLEAEVVQASSSVAEFIGLDEVVTNEVELNLTVPSHNLYGEYQMPEEEFEEFEDDFEIEMSMLMNGDKQNEEPTQKL